MTGTLYVVHCIDTEGPLTEDLEATFGRVRGIFDVKLDTTLENLHKLQRKEIPLGGKEDAVARALAPELLKYNNSWDEIGTMLDDAMSPAYRNALKDDAGGGWVYSWHCVDHMGYADNPRQKDMGYGNVFRFYKNKIAETNSTRDEINWHFHPLSLTRGALQCATSYVNSYDVMMQILCRRIIDECWYPAVNRPGFHSTRPDSHAFMEQWVPYDYANQSGTDEVDQPDLSRGRLGDWRRAPVTWAGYHPHHDDYQRVGDCHRWIFRCLNVGTRIRAMKEAHVREAFAEAQTKGSAILAFCNHDYRDIRPDVEQVRTWLKAVKPDFARVKMVFAGAHDAARKHSAFMEPHTHQPIKLKLTLEGMMLHIRVASGTLFGPQPFLAIKTKVGEYFHDNCDVQVPGAHYTYVFDGQTLPLTEIATIAAGAAGRDGSTDVQSVEGL